MTDLIFSNIQEIEQYLKFNFKIVQILKNLRLKNKITENDMAIQLGISRGKLRGIENGSVIDIIILIKYCEINKMTLGIVVEFD